MWELCICNDLEQSLLLVRQVLQCQEKGTFSNLSVSELTSETSTYTSQITLEFLFFLFLFNPFLNKVASVTQLKVRGSELR